MIHVIVNRKVFAIVVKMKLADNCVVCERSMKYGDIVPDRADIVHKACYGIVAEGVEEQMTCPFCGDFVISTTDVIRKKYQMAKTGQIWRMLSEFRVTRLSLGSSMVE